MNNRTQKNARFASCQQAFTLVELLVVIAIIGILAGMIFPAVSGALEKANVTSASARLSQMAQAVQAFKAEYGYYPTIISENGIDGDKKLTLTPGAKGKEFFNCLSGEDNTGGNRKLKSFMQFNDDEYAYLYEGDDTRGPMNGSTLDIVIYVDSNNDGKITIDPVESSVANFDIRTDVAVIAEGDSGLRDGSSAASFDIPEEK